MFLICLFFAPLPFLSTVPHLSPPPLWISVPTTRPPLFIPHSPPFLKHSTSPSLPLLLSCTPSCIAASLIAHVGKYICRRQKGDSLSLSVSPSLSLPLSLPPVSFFFPLLSLPDIPPMWSQQAASASVVLLPFSRLQLTSLCVRERKERGNEGTRERGWEKPSDTREVKLRKAVVLQRRSS